MQSLNSTFFSVYNIRPVMLAGSINLYSTVSIILPLPVLLRRTCSRLSTPEGSPHVFIHVNVAHFTNQSGPVM